MNEAYITMTDSATGGRISGGRISKLVFTCETSEDVDAVINNAETLGMKRISTAYRCPSYPSATHITAYHTKADYPKWYVKNSFDRC